MIKQQVREDKEKEEDKNKVNNRKKKIELMRERHRKELIREKIEESL